MEVVLAVVVLSRSSRPGGKLSPRLGWDAFKSARRVHQLKLAS